MTEITIAEATIIAAVFGFLGTFVGVWYKAKQDRKKDSDLIQAALKVLLRRELSTQHEQFVSSGKITRSALAEFENTYEVYEKLYGINGFVDDIAKDVRELEVVR